MEGKMLWPEKRPHWLGMFQSWPCGRCGKEADDYERHWCEVKEGDEPDQGSPRPE